MQFIFEWWIILLGHNPPRWSLLFYWNFLITNKAMGLPILTMIGMTLMSCLNATSLPDTFTACSLTVGLYGCVLSQLFLSFRRDDILQLMRQLRAIAAHMEERATADDQARSLELRARLRMYAIVYLGYWPPVFLTLMLLSVAVGDAVLPMWPRPENGWGLFGAGVVQHIGLFVAGTIYFSIGALMFSGIYGMAEMFRVLGRQLSRACRPEHVRVAVKHHQQLCEAARDLDLLFRQVIPHYLFSILSPPLLSIADLVHLRSVHMFGVLSLPVVFMMLPLSYAGQELIEASGEMGLVGFWRAWGCGSAGQGLQPAARRDLLLLITRAHRPCSVSLLGPTGKKLDLRAYYAAMKSWFSYLQMLLNLQ